MTGEVSGSVRLVAAIRNGATYPEVLECRAPLALRVTGHPGPVLHLSLLHTGAGYFEHDRTRVDIEVREGASVQVSTPGASLAFPCSGSGWSTADVGVQIGSGGFLAWLPEPLIAAQGCSHRGRTQVHLEQGGEAIWREEICAGRTGENAGRVELSFSADLGPRPLLRDATLLGREGVLGPRVLAAHRFSGTLACLGRRAAQAPGVMQLAGPGSVVRAVAGDALGVRRILDEHLALFGISAGVYSGKTMERDRFVSLRGR